jgi:hypothetical protein
MRLSLLLWMGALLLAAQAAPCEEIALERVPDEAVRMGVTRLSTLISRMFPDPPVKVSPSADTSAAYKGEGVVLLVVPDSGLGKKSLEEASEKATPAGWLVVRGLGPVVEGGIPPLDRLATLESDGNEGRVTLLFLAVRREGEKRLLEIYSRGTKPLLRLTLSRKEGAAARTLPLDVNLHNLDPAAKQVDCLVLLPDGHQAELRLGANE